MRQAWQALLITLLIPLSGRADLGKLGEQWRWVRFTTDAGLPSNRVLDVMETRAGVTWAATPAGLAWFDGYCWHPVGDKDGLPRGMVKKISECAGDDILVLSGDRLYRGGPLGFKELAPAFHGMKKKVTGLCTLPDRRVIVVADSTLYELISDSLLFFPLPATVEHQRIVSIATTREGGVWVNTTSELYRLGKEGWSRPTMTGRQSLEVGYVVGARKGQAVLYVGSPYDERGVWEVDLRNPPRRIFDHRQGMVNSIDVDSTGDVVVVFETGKIACRNGQTWGDLPGRPDVMKDVLFLRFRSNGDFWMGTESALYLFLASSSRWSYWPPEKTDERMAINDIAAARDGSIWVGSGKGLQVHHDNGVIEVIDKIDGTPISYVTGIAQDGDGNIWVSSGGGFEGVFRWDGDRWKHFGRPEGLEARYVHRVAIDRKGRPWFLGLMGYGTRTVNDQSGPGAFVYDDGVFTRWGTPEGLVSGKVYAFAEGNNGDYWFGTRGGISRWSRGKWTTWNTRQGLKGDKVFTLAVDGRNDVWFGDQSNGLGVIHHDTVRYYSTADGLISDAVWEVDVDARGRLWIATRGGLGSYENGEWCSFGPASGLSHTRLWPLLPTPSKILMGTTGGGVAILSLKDEVLHASRSVPAEPVIDKGSVLLRWRAYSYFGEKADRDVETRYRLDDQPYSAWSCDRDVTLLNVSPGRHSFSLQAKNLFGEYDSIGQVVSFEVPPPMYRQIQFLLPVVLLALGVAGLAVMQSVRRTRFEAALRRNEALYRSVVEDQSEFIMRFLPGGTRTFANAAYCRHFGTSNAEVIGTNFFTSLSEDNKKRVRSKLAALTPESPVATDEHCSVGEDGELRWHQWTDRAIFGEGGSILEFQSVGHDVTRLKLAEQEIGRKEEYLRQVIDANPNLIFVRDAEGRFTLVNRAVADACGSTTDAMVGRTDADFNSDPEEVGRFLASDREVLNSGVVKVIPEEIVRNIATGERRWYQTIRVPLKSGEVLGVTTDITELKSNQARLSEALRIARLAYWEYDVRKDLFTFNDQFYSILRTTAAQEGGYDMTSEAYANRFIPPEDRSLVAREVERAVKSGDPDYKREIDHRVIYADGRAGYVSVLIRVLKDGEGRTVKTQGVLEEITERKETEIALQQSLSLLQATLESTADGILVVDPAGKIAGHNRRFAEMWHIPPEVLAEKDDRKAVNHVLSQVRDPETFLAKVEEAYARPDSESFDAIEFADGRVYERYSRPQRVGGVPVGRVWSFRDVTGQKQAERALRESEEQYRSLVEASPDAISVTDLTGRLTFVSQKALELFGESSVAHVVGRNIVEWVPPLDQEAMTSALQRLRETGEIGSAVVTLHRSDGTMFWGEVNGALIRSNDGPPKGIILVTRDVTDRRKAEEALRKWANTFEHARWGVATSSVDGETFDLMNPEFARMHGYTVEELVGTPIMNMYPPESRGDFQDQTRIAQDQGRNTFESRHLRKDGSTFPVLVDMAIIRDQEGKISYRAVNVLDITERKRTEDALHKSVERQRLLLRSIPMAFYTASASGKMQTTWISEQASDITGYTQQQFVEDTMFWSARLHPDDADRAVKEYESILEKMSIVNEYRWLCADGSYRWFLDLTVLTTNEQTGEKEIIGAWLDITDRKKMEQELLDSRSRLTMLNECLLSFGPDPDENINKLVALCGRQLDGTAALYNRLDGENLCSLGQWNTPVDFELQDKARGHICYDVIHRKDPAPVVIRNLPETAYGITDPHVSRYGLKTYVGKAVAFADNPVGSLCVVFDRDYSPSDEDLKLLGIAAAAIGVEEKRREAEKQLRQSEHQYRLLFTENPHPMYVHDIGTFEFLAVNDAAVSQYGYSREEFLSMSIKDIRPGEDVSSLMQSIRETAEDTVYSGEWRHRRKDGTVIDVDISAHRTQFAGRRARIILAMDVTARKRAEERVAVLGHTIRSISEAVSITDLDNRIMFVNDAFLSLYGYREEELLGRSIELVRSPLQRLPEVASVLDGTKKGGWHGELINRKNDGTLFPVSLSTSVVHDDKGQVIGLVGVAEDITERRQAQESLQKRERQLGEAQRIGHTGSWEWDSATNEAECSDELYRIFGRDPRTFKFSLDTFLETPHPGDRDMVKARVRKILESREPDDFDYRIVIPGGEVRWIHGKAAVVAGSAGTTLFYGTAQDITERKKVEEVLAESEEHLRLAINGAQMYTWDWNLQTDRLVRNGHYLAFLGSGPSRADSTFARFREMIHPDDVVKVDQAIHQALQGTDPYHADFRILLPDGGIVWVETHGQAYRDNTGEVVRMIGVTQDVTARKQAEERIRASLQEKETLLKEIHHRVKNNLQVISSLLNLQSRYVTDNRALGLFRESQDRVKSMAMIHEKLYQSEDLANIHFGGYVRNLTAYLFRSYVVDPDLVAMSVKVEDVRLNIDKAIPCGLIINELVSNSLKHAFPAGRAGRITVSLCARSEASVSLVVRDNGVGLPEGFDLHSTTSLGLQLVASLADQLGAVVSLERAGGTEYTLTFPL